MELLQNLVTIDLKYFIVGMIVLFLYFEHVFDKQYKGDNKTLHWANNFLFLIVFVVLNFLWAYVVVFCMEWLNGRQVGLFYLFEMPYWLKLILGVAMLDFVSYWFHRLGHHVPVLWRFHRVHHSDTKMDASTNFRGHPIESFLWFGTSNILAAGIFGIDLIAFGLYFFIITPLFFLEHANLRFPTWLDKTVGLVFTTPNIHKIHHDQDQYYTDSNFADIFIIWDRMFGTFKYKPPQEILLGLKEFEDEKKQTFWYLMKSPFHNVKRIGSDELEKGN